MNSRTELWRAVVEQAVKDLESASEEIKKEAAQWLLRDNKDFFIVTKLANLDGKEIRKHIEKRIHNG